MTGSDGNGGDRMESDRATAQDADEVRRANALARIMDPPRARTDEIGDEAEEIDEHHDDEHIGHSLAVTALWGLVGVIAVASTTLWLAPKLAPHVPAPVGRLLAPVPDLFEEQISVLRNRIEVRERETEAMLDAFEARLSTMAGRGTDSATADEVRRLESELAAMRATLEGTDQRADRADRRAADVERQIEAARGAMKEALERAVAAERSASAAIVQADAETETATDLAKSAQRRSTEAAAGVDALERRLSGLDDRFASLAGEVRAVSSSLAEASEDPADQPVSRELSAALLALQAKVDALEAVANAAPDYVPRTELDRLATAEALAKTRAQNEARLRGVADAIKALEGRLDAEIAAVRRGLTGDLAKLEADVGNRVAMLADRVESAQSTAAQTKAQALDEAEAALRNAAFRGAADALRTRFDAGDAYAGVLAELELLADRPAPVVLAAHAATGVPSVETLVRRLPERARSALEARARSTPADDGPGARIANWIGTQVVSRPIEETEGTDLAARLSRIEARMRDGALQAARAEAEALPPPARAVMADWTGDLVARIDGAAALEAFLAPGFATE